MKKFKGELGLVMTTLIWAYSFIACNSLLEYMTSFQILAFRFIIASVIMLAIAFKELRKADKGTVFWGICLGVILYIGFSFQLTGLKYTTPSQNAFITTLHVVFVPFISFVVFRKKVDVYSIIAAAVAFMGTAVLSLDGNLTVNKGNIMTAIGAFFYSFHIFFLSNAASKKSALSLTALQLVTCAAIGTIVTLCMGQFDLKVINSQTGPTILYLAVVCTAICFFTQAYFQKFTSEVTATIILSMEGAFSSIFSVMLAIETYSWRLFLGSVLIFTAGIISHTKLSFVKFNKFFKNC